MRVHRFLTVTVRSAGFTLIEIIIVLVLLGILASVAVPKYFDLTTSAEKKAVQGSVAEAQARILNRFGQLLLQGNSCMEAVKQVTSLSSLADRGSAFGEFSLYVDSNASKTNVTTVPSGSPIWAKRATDDTAWSTGAKLYLPQCDATAYNLGVEDYREATLNAIAKILIAKSSSNIDSGAVAGSSDKTSEAAKKLFNALESQDEDAISKVLAEIENDKNTVGSSAAILSAVLELQGFSLAGLGATSWHYNSSEKQLYWTNQDISKMNVGDSVSVMAYDIAKKQYAVSTATVQQKKVTLVSNKQPSTYNVLTPTTGKLTYSESYNDAFNEFSNKN